VAIIRTWLAGSASAGADSPPPSAIAVMAKAGAPMAMMVLDVTMRLRDRCDDNRELSVGHASLRAHLSPGRLPRLGSGASASPRDHGEGEVTESNSPDTQGVLRTFYVARTCACTCSECRNIDYEMDHSGHSVASGN
jgi:hypothetical protein